MSWQALLFLPGESVWAASPGLLFWRDAAPMNGTNSTVAVASHVGGDNPKLCPRASICSEGPLELLLIAIARTSAYSLYVAVALAFLTKCYCSLHWLRTTPVGLYVPLQWCAATTPPHTPDPYPPPSPSAPTG